MELFSVTCATCKARIKVRKAEAIGEIFSCPRCQSMVQIVPPADWQAPRMAEKAFVDPQSEVVDKPSHAPEESQLPERPSRRWLVWAALPAVACVLLVAWMLRSGAANSSEESLASSLPAEPPAAIVERQPPEPASPTAEPAETKPQLPLRWLPADARVVITIDPRTLAARPELLAQLTQVKALWRDALLPLETAFRLPPERIARITWAAGELENWQTGGMVVVELATPLTDDAELLADSEKLDLRLDDAICHRRLQGAWKLPFAVVDERTLVSGTLEALTALAKRQDDSSLNPAMTAALRDLDLARPFAVAADMAALRNQSQGLVPLLDDWASGDVHWPAVRDVPAAGSLSLSLGGELQAEVVLACSNANDAIVVHKALTQLLAAAARGVSAEEAALLEQLTVSGPTPEAGRRSLLLSEADAALKSRELAAEGQRVVLRSHWLGRPDQVLAGALAMLPAPAPPAADAVVQVPAVSPAAVAPPVEPPLPALPKSVVSPGQSEVDVAARLKDPVKGVDFQKLPLNQLVVLLSQLSTVPIELDAGSLGEAGVALDVPVTVVLAETNVGKILDAALGPLKLKHEIETGKLVIRKK